MSTIDKSKVIKIKGTYRGFCAFISFCALIGLFGALTFGTKDSLIGGLIASLVPLAILYVCVPIILSGYPPSVLMWTLEGKEDQ